jgi:hypothetical protein
MNFSLGESSVSITVNNPLKKFLLGWNISDMNMFLAPDENPLLQEIRLSQFNLLLFTVNVMKISAHKPVDTKRSKLKSIPGGKL